MSLDTPFPGAGLTPNHIPNPPPDMPDAPGPGDATASLSPFSEPQDIESIKAQLVLDRPLKLYIPNRQDYPEWEFRIINSIPQEIADAHNKGFRQVTDEKLTRLFNDLVAGTDEDWQSHPKAEPPETSKSVRRHGPAQQGLERALHGQR